MEREEIAQHLQDEIKLYRHLGLEAVEISSVISRFKAKLDANLNHKGTAFGGSLYAIGVLSAYALIFATLKEHEIETENIVIAKGEIKYLRPVDRDFEVSCGFATQYELEEFVETLRESRKIRQSLNVEIKCADQICANLQGLFVVKL
jgi:thioesterase domain-containing protein